MSQNKNAGSLHLYRSDHSVRLPVAGKFNPQIQRKEAAPAADVIWVFNRGSKGSGSRVAGISEVHSRLALKEDERPGLVIFSNCKNLIRTVPALVYDTRRPEDIADGSEDHAFDALRYGLLFRPFSSGRAPVRF